MDKANRVKFFEETFLVANVRPEVVFRMLFLTLSSANIDFSGWKLRWRTYTTKEAFPTTRHVELVGKKEFATAALDPEYKTYVVHVASLSSTPLNVHPFRRSQISDLIAEEALTKVSDKYADLADVFSPDLTAELPKHNGIENYAIELVNGQQPPYRLIYSLGLVELETLKAYIETNLANGFIRPSTSPAGAPIPFNQTSDGSFQLYVNYRDLNNLMIKN